MNAIGRRARAIVGRGLEPPRCLGRQECERLALDFQSVFCRNFVLAKHTADVPDDWAGLEIGDWKVFHCQKLECRQIIGTDGTELAVVLGVAMLPDGTPMPERHVLAASDMLSVETAIEQLSGRFVAVAKSERDHRLYVDPSCSLVPFFDPEGERISSCIPLVLDRPLVAADTAQNPDFQPDPDTFFFFGDTPDRYVQRVLANHYLDLNQFEQTRHWPKDDTPFDIADSGAEQLDEIMAVLRCQIEGLIRNYRCAFPVTGGGDSRILLAAAGNVLDDVSRFFVHVNNKASGMDSLIATSICEHLNIPLQIISTVSPRVRAQYDTAQITYLTEIEKLRTSFHSTASPTTLIVHDAAPKADLVLRGGLVEMTRLNKWRPDWGDVTPELGLRALAKPRQMDDDFVQNNVARYAKWLSGLPEMARPFAVDLGHCEIWLPALAHTNFMGPRNYLMINPFNNRRILHMTMCLGHHFRKSGKPQNYIVRNYLPEVRKIPYTGQDFAASMSEETGDADILKVIGRRFK